MANILLVTVGGAPQPIITSINTLQPDRVIFFCTKDSEPQITGAGKPCIIRRSGEEIKIPNIPSYTKLGERFQAERDIVRFEDADDAAGCHRVVSAKVRELLQEGHDLSADYTGGTKAMAMTLGMTALDYGLKLYVTTKLGRNLKQPVSEGEETHPISTAFIDLDRKFNQLLPIFLRQYNYSAAVSELEKLQHSVPLFPETRSLKKQIRERAEFCEALEAWDRFEHKHALCLLEPFLRRDGLKVLGDFLKRVIHSRDDIDENFSVEKTDIPYHGYEIVEDLLLSAARRAAQKRYDDGVGRLYRALELLMQIYFKRQYKALTLDMDLDLLPDNLPKETREYYEKSRNPVNGRLTLAYRRGYELLRAIPGDPLGTLYASHARKINAKIEMRNLSLFAHGFRPVSPEDYDEFERVVGGFLKTAIASLRPPEANWSAIQFPLEFPIS